MTVQLHSRFSEVAKQEEMPQARRKRGPRPISIRVTREERARLESEAGGRTLSAYVRARLFGPKGKRGPDRKVSTDAATLARLLAAFGQSDLAASMRAVAQAARSGTLECGPDLFARLEHACADIAIIRRELIVALGVKPE